MKLLLDSSVWVEHLRHGVLAPILAVLPGRYLLHLDAIVASELRAACRTRRERRLVDALCAPHERGQRLLLPTRADFECAALALSRLRERGRFIAVARGSLRDGLIAAIAAREGALLVTAEWGDFSALASQMPLRVELWEAFRKRHQPAD